MKQLLIIGQTFPEPKTTAAGARMMQLISLFEGEGYQINFATTASTSNHSAALKERGVHVFNIQLNNASFDDFIIALQPSTVLYDRFVTQEQFGWRVSKHCPDAATILDTEDLHFLRKAREEGFKKFGDATKGNLFSETAKREIASILQCDLTLIISKYEMQLLVETFSIPSSLLVYLPFLLEKKITSHLPSFNERDGFMTIGNLHHAPNVDAVIYLKKEIWPLIKKQLPQATLSIYGMYAPQQVLECHNPKEGFLIKGWAASSKEVLQKARVMLAPLRFGAGLKGKVIDALQYGTPFITTPIGAEGIFTSKMLPTSYAENTSQFVEKATALYSQKSIWEITQQKGWQCLEDQFLNHPFSEVFLKRCKEVTSNLQTHRQQHFVGQILQHKFWQASAYMGRWIEEKNKNS